MSIFDILDKLDDIVYEPIKLMTDWAREPLKSREHRRSVEAYEHKVKVELEARIREASHAVDIDIKKQTEITRILAEIDEMKKDKEFARLKAVSDAIMQYQQYLTRLNVEAVNAIGNMQLELRERAQNLVYEKTIKYKELQDSAHVQALEEIVQIEEKFANNEVAKNILYRSVDTRLGNIITTAQNFLIELNTDIGVLNRSINLLTEKGQSFIENHLGQFHVVTNAGLLSNTANSEIEQVSINKPGTYSDPHD